MRRVAVVHPVGLLRVAAGQTLAHHGFAPIEFETTEDAAQVLAADPPDVAVVDESVAAALGPVRVRWVALGRPSERQALMAAGAACFVPKPFGIEDLVRAVLWVIKVYGPM